MPETQPIVTNSRPPSLSGLPVYTSAPTMTSPTPQRSNTPEPSPANSIRLSDLIDSAVNHRSGQNLSPQTLVHIESETGLHLPLSEVSLEDGAPPPTPPDNGRTEITLEELIAALGDMVDPNDGTFQGPVRTSLGQGIMDALRRCMGDNLATKVLEKVVGGTFSLNQFGYAVGTPMLGGAATTWIKICSQLQLSPTNNFYKTSDGKVGCDLTFFAFHDEIGMGGKGDPTNSPHLGMGTLYVTQHGFNINVEFDVVNKKAICPKVDKYVEEQLIRGEFSIPHNLIPYTQTTFGTEIGLTKVWDMKTNPDWKYVMGTRLAAETAAGVGTAYLAVNSGMPLLVDYIQQVRFGGSELARQVVDRMMHANMPPTSATTWINALTIGAIDVNGSVPGVDGLALTYYPRENLGFARTTLHHSAPQQEMIDQRNHSRASNGDVETGIDTSVPPERNSRSQSEILRTALRESLSRAFERNPNNNPENVEAGTRRPSVFGPHPQDSVSVEMEGGASGGGAHDNLSYEQETRF